MEVCGITVINTPNYGAVLQGFALQKVIEDMGHSYQLLNYYNRFQEQKFTFFGHPSGMSWSYYIAKKVLYPIRRYQCKKILKFQNEKLNLTKRIKDKKNVQSIVSEKDVFVCGSDQIWNNEIVNNYDDIYFLAFAKGKHKVAYAPSFAKKYEELTEKDINFYRDQLVGEDKIDCLSVREESAKEIVKNIAQKDVPVVCDPVFLLTADEWNAYSVSTLKNKYIFVFLLGNNSNSVMNRKIIAQAKAWGKVFNCKVKVVIMGLSSILFGKIWVPRVEEWLGLVSNSEFVFTNSFHGMAFSMIYHKEFYCFVDSKFNGKTNTRINDFLRKIKLEDRIVDINNIAGMKRQHMRYEDADKVLQQFVHESYIFLENALKQ